MKSNHAYHWTITLVGKHRSRHFAFVGTGDAALHEADVCECHVSWQVVAYILTRGRRAKASEVRQ